MFIGFGEIMARLAPPERLRWRQAVPGRVEVTWGGGEANVCASLALFGAPARFVTALPKNVLAESVAATLRGLGVDTSQILWRDSGRLGLYFVEAGANQRGSTVLYDREHSAVSLARPEEYDFATILEGGKWLHVTGITPAISEPAMRTNLALVQEAKARGLSVSCDLNFRKKLWRWRPGTNPKALAKECMSQVLTHVDLVIANEEDAADVLDITAHGTNVERGHLDAAAYGEVAQAIVGRFPNVSKVAITLRESLSADHNNWGALLYDAPRGNVVLSPHDVLGNYSPFEIRDIVDRVGGGDSFAAGLLYALNSPDMVARSVSEGKHLQHALDFAVAASCLKHSVQGDFNYVTKDEVLALMAGNASGRVQR
jgi:2-dehydro-3-deoxygluconokinase